jgi:hypothetical protein
MPKTDAVVSGKVLTLDVKRPRAGGAGATPERPFQEVLDTVERTGTGEVVPFPSPALHGVPSRVWAPMAPELDALESLFNRVEGRLTTLETGVLSLKHQVSALLRCF